MAGTRIQGLKLVKVVDGDTLTVEINGQNDKLRLACLDTEESYAGGSKPVTNAGKEASRLAKAYFGTDEEGFPQQEVLVDIEFDTADPETICLKRHRGNYGRLICYVHKDGDNYNLKAIREGWSPYFAKYGRSRMYHDEFLAAEASAQAEDRLIWDQSVNAGGQTRDYSSLVPWWNFRGSVVQDYRQFGIQHGVLSVRMDYEDVVDAAKSESNLTVLCDLQSGINKWTNDGALIYGGSKTQKFNLWIPDRYTNSAQAILRLIEKRYANHGRSYVYVSGQASTYRETPQIVLTDIFQLSDSHPS